MSAPNVEKEPGPVETPAASTPDAVEPEKKKREYKDFGHEQEAATRESRVRPPAARETQRRVNFRCQCRHGYGMSTRCLILQRE